MLLKLPDADNVNSFKIYRGTFPKFEVNSASLIDSTFIGTYFDNFAQMNSRYYYKITAVDFGNKESLPSVANSDLILNSTQLQTPSNLSKFTAPFKFQWTAVDSAVAYKVFVGNSPFADVIWESVKVQSNETTYNGSTLTTSKVYYWWVGSYSREKIIVDNGNEIEPQINSYSMIGSFVGE